MSEGKITLTDIKGNIADIKVYKGKANRKKIIERWQRIYKTDFYIIIAPIPRAKKDTK